MPLRIWSSRTLSTANTVVLMLGGASFSMWFFLSLYLQQVRGDSPITTGLAFLPMTLCIVAGAMFASRMVSRIGARTLLVGGMLSLTAGLAWYTQLSPGGSYWGTMFAPSLLAAIGIGVSFTPAAISGVAGVASHEAGLASGLINTARMFGGALGLAVLATLATAHTTAELHAGVGLPQALTNGFHLAFVIGAGMSLVGAAVAAGLPSGERARSRRRVALEV
jgi:MFS family permease